MLDHFATSQDRDENGKTVAAGETDGCYSRETVESGCRAKVDEPEKAVDDGGEDETPERDVQGGIGGSDPFATGESSISSESVGATACGGEGTYAGEEEDAEDEEEETEASAGGACDDFEERSNRLAAGDV